MRLLSVILFSILAIANLLIFLLIGAGFNLFQFIICLIIVIVELVKHASKKEIKYPKVIFVFLTLIAALLVLWVSSFGFGFGKMGIYGLKLKYADFYGYTTDHFPNSVPQGAKLKDMGMLPTIMQGAGNVHATFGSDGQTIRTLEQKASDNSIMSFTLKQYLNDEIPKEYVDKAQKIFDTKYSSLKGTDAVIKVDYSKIINDYKNRYDQGGTTSQNDLNNVIIYIIDSNFYWNHLRTNSVVVDHNEGLIEYTGD